MNAVYIFRILVAVCISVFMTGSVVFAVDTEFTRDTLKGIQGVYILMEELQPNIHKYGAKVGLTKEQLQEDEMVNGKR